MTDIPRIERHVLALRPDGTSVSIDVPHDLTVVEAKLVEAFVRALGKRPEHPSKTWSEARKKSHGESIREGRARNKADTERARLAKFEALPRAKRRSMVQDAVTKAAMLPKARLLSEMSPEELDNLPLDARS